MNCQYLNDWQWDLVFFNCWRTDSSEWRKKNQNMMLLAVITIRFQKYWNQIRRARVWKWIRNSDEEQFDDDINGSIEEEYTDDSIIDMECSSSVLNKPRRTINVLDLMVTSLNQAKSRKAGFNEVCDWVKSLLK